MTRKERQTLKDKPVLKYAQLQELLETGKTTLYVRIPKGGIMAVTDFTLELPRQGVVYDGFHGVRTVAKNKRRLKSTTTRAFKKYLNTV